MCPPCNMVEETKVDIVRKHVDDGRQLNVWSNITFKNTCVRTTTKLLRNLAMLDDSVIEDVQIVLHPFPKRFTLQPVWRPNNLTVIVPESAEKEPADFVDLWLQRLFHIDKVNILTIKSPYDVNIRTRASYLTSNIKNLTINAKAKFEDNFLSHHQHMNIAYNDAEHDSPLAIDHFLSFWERKKNEEGFKRRIEFNCKHTVYDLTKYENRLQCEDESLNITSNEASLPEEHRFTKTFKLDETCLLIDINTTNENNDGNSSN